MCFLFWRTKRIHINQHFSSIFCMFKPSSRHRIRIYENPDFNGQMIEFSEDMPNLLDRWQYREIQSAHVQDGIWVFYEHPNYRGRQYLLEKGEYRRHAEWGALHSTVGSIRRVIDF